MTQSETTKTIIFVVSAVILLAIVGLTGMQLQGNSADEMKNQELFPDFTDPLLATSIKIVRLDDETTEPVTFEVAQIGGEWRIPSNDNYPADAKEHLGRVASSLMDLRVLSIAMNGENVTDLIDEHTKYGVLDPAGPDAGVGEGAGIKVVMLDADKRVLMDLVIGDSVPERTELRYVRVADQDPVYVAQVRTDQLSTSFDDWIEKNLLGIDAWDIQQVTINDYHLEEVQQRQGLMVAISKQPKMDGLFTLDYDSMGSPAWVLKSEQVPQDGMFVDRPLGEDEELNTDNLDDLKNALDDLKIVNVATKPERLAKRLAETGSFSADQGTEASLQSCGFFFSRDPYDPNAVGLLSDQGEIWITMKDGVRYVLRFGELTGESSAKQDEAEQLVDELIVDDGEAGDEADDVGGMHRYLFIMAMFDANAIERPELTPLPEIPAGEAATVIDFESIKAERERAERENQRKQDDYDQLVQDGKDRVADLNRQFAPWYYVIDESVYKKIHLTRAELVREKSDESALPANIGGGMPPGMGMGGMGGMPPGMGMGGMPSNMGGMQGHPPIPAVPATDAESMIPALPDTPATPDDTPDTPGDTQAPEAGEQPGTATPSDPPADTVNPAPTEPPAADVSADAPPVSQ